jgi:hypothetical protein
MLYETASLAAIDSGEQPLPSGQTAFLDVYQFFLPKTILLPANT